MHRDFLATQTANAFDKPIAIRTGKHKKGDFGLSCICTIQWLLAKGNINKLPRDYTLIIADEAHECDIDTSRPTLPPTISFNSRFNPFL